MTTPTKSPNPPPLTKAVLYRLKDTQPAGKGKPPSVERDGEPITVQFNPTSLKIQRQNNIDKGLVSLAKAVGHAGDEIPFAGIDDPGDQP